MKVHVDMNLCQSHGECVLVAPDVFELGDDDVLVWKEDVAEERRAEMEAGGQRLPDDGHQPRGLTGLVRAPRHRRRLAGRAAGRAGRPRGRFRGRARRHR